MGSLTLLYEENGFTVSKLEIWGAHYYIVQHTATGRRYIRRTLPAVDAIVRSAIFPVLP